MSRVSESAKLYLPAERVWQTVGPFTGIADWHPAVLRCDSGSQGIETERRLDLGDPQPLVERLQAHDDAQMAYCYTTTDGPLPVGQMKAELRVKPDDATSCTVEWSAELEQGDEAEGAAIAAVRDFFRRGLEHLRFSLGG